MTAIVRRAERADLDAASAVLADAFADYPWTRWTVDGDNHRERVRGLQRMAMDRVALPYGEIWVAADEAGELVSVAAWMITGVSVPASVLDAMAAEQAALEGVRHVASVAAEEFVSPLRPSGPHYYLGAVGTRGDRQRQGYGAAVLAPLLERAGAEHATVFLETSARENVGFYAGLGFVTTAEVRVPGGGPPVWAMTRPG